MAVYRRGYQRYEGAFTGRWSRLFVLPKFAWERLMQQRLVVILFVAATFWPVACGGFVYLSHHAELLQGFGPEASRMLVFVSPRPMTSATRRRCAGLMCRPHFVRRHSTSSAERAHSWSRMYRSSRSVRPPP